MQSSSLTNKKLGVPQIKFKVNKSIEYLMILITSCCFEKFDIIKEKIADNYLRALQTTVECQSTECQ